MSTYQEDRARLAEEIAELYREFSPYMYAEGVADGRDIVDETRDALENDPDAVIVWLVDTLEALR